jgi:hypothetical protein
MESVTTVSAISSAANSAADLLFEDDSGELANLVNLLVRELDGNEFYSTVGEESSKQGQVLSASEACTKTLSVVPCSTRVVCLA